MDYELGEKISEFIEITDDAELAESDLDFSSAGSPATLLLMEHIHVLLESPTMDESDSEAKRVAYECLARFAESHYDSLGPYAATFFSDCGYAIGSAPGVISLQPRQEEPDEVKAAALEFLVNVALAERERADSGQPHSNFIAEFAPRIVPIVLHGLLRLPGFGDEQDAKRDIWNVRQNILSVVALVYASFGPEPHEKAPVTNVVSPFVMQYARSQQWKERQAGLLALGAAASADAVEASAIAQLLPVAAESILHPVYGVRDAAVWAVQNLVAAQRDASVVAFQSIPDCLNAVVRALADPASPIAAQAATTIHLMTSSPMLQNVEAISALLGALMAAFDRDAENGDSLRDTVSYAFGQLIGNAPAECNQSIFNVTAPIFNRLATCLNPVEIDRSILPPLSIMFAALAKRMGAGISEQTPAIMQQVIGCLKAKPTDDTLRVCAALIIQGLAGALGPQFEPFVAESLTTIVGSPPTMDRASAMIASACAKALGPKIAIFAEAVIQEAFQTLINPYIPLDARASLTTCIGDVCAAVGGEAFAPYLAPAITSFTATASQAITRVKNADDEDDDPDTTCDLLRALLLASTNLMRNCVINDKPTETTVIGLAQSVIEWAGTTLKYSERRRIDADAALDALALVVERFAVINGTKNVIVLQTIGQGLSSNLIRRDLGFLNLQQKWEELIARIQQLLQ